MEIIEFLEKKRAFATPEERYKNPYKEAIKLHHLWTYRKPPSKRKEIQGSKTLLKQASKLIDKDEELCNVQRMITKGLFLNPRFHALYALRGDIYLREGRLSEAIQNYECGKLMTKFDNTLSETEAKVLYNKQLIEAYTKRGNWYYDNNLLLEAVYDCEQVLVLKLRDISIVNVEGKLLELLRKLNKYEVFRRYWEQFVKNADNMRTSDLLTIHAEYKIHLNEMLVARQMLIKALHLNRKNDKADDLLQVVYSSGHTLAGFTVIWCMHCCYDKALVTIEKSLDCIPYNPGFILLKAIILRLSGRLEQATRWLEYVHKNCYKLHDPLKNKRESILGNLTIKKTKTELIKQWYLIRYDMAMKCILNNNLNEAARIIYASQLTKYYTEPYILLGDIFYMNGEVNLALNSYLKCREKIRELRLRSSRKSIDLSERIIDILNSRAQKEARAGNSKNLIHLADNVLQILSEDGVKLNELGMQRGRALLQKARGLLQDAKRKRKHNKECCKIAADSLQYVREHDDVGLYRSLYGDRGTESVIDRFAPKRDLPRSLKLLMQYS